MDDEPEPVILEIIEYKIDGEYYCHIKYEDRTEKDYPISYYCSDPFEICKFKMYEQDIEHIEYYSRVEWVDQINDNEPIEDRLHYQQKINEDYTKLSQKIKRLF